MQGAELAVPLVAAVRTMILLGIVVKARSIRLHVLAQEEIQLDSQGAWTAD